MEWKQAELINKKTGRVIAYGVAKKDNRGFDKFSLIPTLKRKKPIHIKKKSSNKVKYIVRSV
jgi:hypothetical protein